MKISWCNVEVIAPILSLNNLFWRDREFFNRIEGHLSKNKLSELKLQVVQAYENK